MNPEEIRKSLRPRIFACIVSGLNLQDDGALSDFLRFQVKLHGGVGEQRRAATICTHDLGRVSLPLTFSVQSVDNVSVRILPNSVFTSLLT